MTELIILLVMLVVMAVVLATMPRPKSEKPSALGDLNVPTVEDGRDITMIFGTVWIDDPNVINYGNLRTRPIYADGGK